MPSARSSTSAPILRNSPATEAMRSDSFSRNSAASRMTVTPSACVAATASTGNSSIERTTVSPEISVARSPSLERTIRSATGSPGLVAPRTIQRQGRAHLREHVPKAGARRVHAHPAQPHIGARENPGCHQREGSGGEVAGDTHAASGRRRQALSPTQAHRMPLALQTHAKVAQHPLGIRRDGPGSWSKVAPPSSTNCPASNNADFTSALATGNRYSMPRRPPPRIARGANLPPSRPSTVAPIRRSGSEHGPWGGDAAAPCPSALT